MNNNVKPYLDQCAFGKRVRAAREALGFSRDAVAESLNCTGQCVGRWERGECMPSYSVFPLLAILLHVTTDYLMTGMWSVA